MISHALYDKNIRNQLRQISFTIDLRTSERTINEKQRERERERSRTRRKREIERVVVYKENERVNGNGRKKRKIVCDGMRIVSKEALVLIKLAPVFSTAI